MNIDTLSNKKYNLKNENIINDGAFANIYDIINNEDKNNNYIVKLQKKEYKYEAINEIEILLKLKKNKNKYINKLKELNISLDKTKVIDLIDYYIDNEYFYLILLKYECTLEYFNILYNKEFNETLPINLIKKIINSLFLSKVELQIQ